MNKTAMQQLKAKTEKAIIYATPDEANLLRGVLVEIESLLPTERQQIKDAYKQGASDTGDDTVTGNHYYSTTYKTS